MMRFIKNIFLLILAALISVQCYASRTQTSRKSEPKSAFRFYENALIAKFDGRWDRALRQINRAIELNNRISLFYVLKAQIFDSLHQVDSAIFAYQQALKVRPHAPDVLQKVGELYITDGDSQTGIAYLKKAFAFDETQTGILLRIARLYIDLDSLDLANDVLIDYKIRTDMAQSPPEPAYYLLKGDMAFMQGNWRQAAEFYDACPCKRCFSEKQVKRAFDVFLKEKNVKRYFKLLTGLNEQKLGEATLFYYRGIYYRTIGNLNEAQHQFELALKHGNKNPELFWDLARIYFRKNETKKIKALYKQLQNIVPHSVYLQKMKALF